MGLTIHYSLHSRGGDAQARQLIQALHQAAQDLPFQQLGAITDLSGVQCDYQHRRDDDPLRWLLIQCRGSVDIDPHSSIRVAPRRLLAFTAWPGEVCESSNFGLCQYPATVDFQGRTIKTKLSGWRWRSFCKTQYASNPACGGLTHFLQCHLIVIALLDPAPRRALCCHRPDHHRSQNAFALSVVETRNITPAVIAREKAHAIKTNGLLEIIETTASLDSIGGLDVLRRKHTFSEQARAYRLPTPEGSLIIGLAGTGKSLTAKATASVFGVPLAKTMAEQIGTLRSWARSRTRVATTQALESKLRRLVG